MTRRGLAFLVLLAFGFGQAIPPAYGCPITVGGGPPTPPPPPNPEGRQPPDNNPSHEDPDVQEKTDPIDLSSGDFVLTRQDLILPGRGLSVDLAFTYRSRSAHNGPFGYGWDFSYHRKVRRLDNGNLVVLRGANRQHEFTFDTASGTYNPPPGVYDRLIQNPDGTYLLTSKHGDKELYDTNGNLTRIEDRNGNALTFTYDSEGLLLITGKSDYFVNQTTGAIAREYRLTRITDTIGRAIDFTYNSEGRLATINYEGRTITYGYDLTGTGDLISIADPLLNTARYAYTNHNLGAVTDPKGQAYLSNVYDVATDRVTSQTYGASTSTLVYGQDAEGNPTTEVTDRRGFRTLFTFDEAGHITRQEQFTDGDPAGEPASYVTSYEYNAAGERTRIIFPPGNATEFTYDTKGNLLEIRRKRIGIPKGQDDASDIVTAFTYEPNFNFVASTTDPHGNTTTYSYDAKGNLLQVTQPPPDSVSPAPVVTLTYNTSGQVETATDPNGNVTKYSYDSATGYLTQLTSGFGTPDAATTSMAYDSVGNVTSVTNPNGHTTTFTYNALNQLTKAVAPSPFLFETHYSYDVNGNLIQTDRQAASSPGPRPALSPTDDWQSTVYTYTTLDQLASVKDDLGNTTAFTYDVNGNRATVTDAKGKATVYSYDERDLLSRVTDAATPAGVTETLYDENGNVASIKDANGNTTVYAYDDFDRLIRTTYADGSFETYTYDLASNLTEHRTPDSNLIQFTYDSLNRLILKTIPQEVTTYTYDAGGHLTTLSDSDATLTYTYDSLNRVTQVATASPGLAATTVGYSYDATGNRTKLTYPDSSFVTYTYDALNRLDLVRDASASALANFTYDPLSRRSGLVLSNGITTTYAYDSANRLTQLTHASSPSSLAAFAYTYDALGNRLTMADATGAHSYTYDPLSQLMAVDYPSGYAFADMTFALDPVGNRTQTVDEGTTPYVTNALNQYTQVGSGPLAYDANGNLVSGGTSTYAYDAESRLTQATAGGMTAAYTYDPLGRRLTKTVNGTTTRFLYDGDQILAETDAAGNITAKYVHSSGIDEPLRMERSGVVSYYHPDGLGSIAALTNSSGAVVERYAYDSYGEPRITDAADNPRASSALGNRFLFTGREWDSESGLYHYRTRAYSPTLGRFLQRDPIGYTAGPNLYTYVDNNPLNFTDPLGLEKVPTARNRWLDSLQLALDAAGFIPGYGVGADILNALIHLGRGRRGQAALSGFAVIPIIGDIAAAGKVGVRADRAIERISATERLIANRAAGNAFRDETADLLRQAGYEVRTEVHKATIFGKRFIDIEVSRAGRVLGGIETKVGKSAYALGQQAKDAYLRLEGYIVTVARDR